MNSFKEKEKKYKYKFFKAVLDKDNNNIHTYVQKYLEYCTDSDIKNIFNKKNNLHGGSFNDDEKKYKKLNADVLKYAEHTKDYDVKNMFGGVDGDDKLEETKYQDVVDKYPNKQTEIEKIAYFQGKMYTKAILLHLKVEEYTYNTLKYLFKLTRLKDVNTKLNNITTSVMPSDTDKADILKNELNTIQKELDAYIPLLDKEKTELETIFNTIDAVKDAEVAVKDANNDIETNKKESGSSADELLKKLTTAKAELTAAETKLTAEFEKVKATLSTPTSTSTATKLPMNYALLDSQYYNNSKFFYNTSDVPEKNKLNIKIYDK